MPKVVLPILHPGQQAVADNESRFNVLACGRRWGKTCFATDRLMSHPEKGALYGNPVAWYAGTAATFKEVWYAALDATRPVQTHVSTQDRQIRLKGGGIIDFWTLHRGDAGGAGRGRKYAQIGIDEAAFVRDLKAIWDEAIRPTLTDYRGMAYIFSTPKGVMNDFYEYFFKRGLSKDEADENWKSWQVSSADNPYLARSELAEMQREYAGRELAYRQEMLAEFVADSGLIFQANWIRQKKAPRFTSVYQAWDTAMTEKTVDKPDPDASVGYCGAKDSVGRLWVLDQIRGHWGTPELVEQILKFQNKWNKNGVMCKNVFIEGGPAGTSCAQVLEDRRREMGQDFRVTTVPPKRDKVTRAVPIANQLARGNAYFEENAPWLPGMVQELIAFPNGRHDDQVDALSLLGSKVAEMAMSATVDTRDGRLPGRIYADEEIRRLRQEHRSEENASRGSWGTPVGSW